MDTTSSRPTYRNWDEMKKPTLQYLISTLCVTGYNISQAFHIIHTNLNVILKNVTNCDLFISI